MTLLAHEMSHSLVARRHGIRVRDITLWMLGGIATIEGNPKTARDDLAIAIAGPATSMTIGLAGGLLSALGVLLHVAPIIVAAVFWVSLINIVLALFNLTPAAPLDGGRILRAWLWDRRGDRRSAAISATHAGRVFAWILMTAGFAEFALGGQLGGLWLIVLGWFVLGASRAEERQEMLDEDLAGVRVRDIMTPHPVTAPESVTIARLVDEFVLRSHGSAFPLTDATGRVTGLVTLDRCKTVPAGQRDRVVARDVCEPIERLTCAQPDDLVLDVLRRTPVAERRVLVFEDQRLVGIMTPRDIMRAVQRAELRADRPARDAA